MRNEKRDYNFYFTHNSLLMQGVFKILEDGYIKRSKDLPQKYHVLGGNEGLEEIYGNIYFDDLIYRQEYWGNHFIINPNIVEKYEFGFRQGWQGYEINVNISDSDKIFWKKIDYIHDYLKYVKMKRKWGDGKIYKSELHHLHEVVFGKNISVRKYVTAIICDLMTDVEMEKIKKIIAKKGYKIKLIKHICDESMTMKQRHKLYKPLKTKELI